MTGVLETGPTAPDPYASNAVSGQVVRSFGSGLGIGLGLRQRHAGSNVLALGVQQEWGSFSGGYTMYSGRTEAAPSPSHRIALNFSYGNRSSIGLSYTTGRDLQAGMLPFTPGVDSRDLALTGYHWLAPQWAVTYDVVNSEQAAYRRQGLRFGIRHTF
jgi:YaiO family outer membrane protein